MQVELRILGLMVDPITQMPMLVLRDVNTDAKVPMWVGAFEAYAIESQLEKVSSPRPMTHDLLKSVVETLGGKVERVVMTDIRDSVFYAELTVRSAAGEHVIDCRPTDGIALALRCGAPIFADTKVIEKAQSIDLSAGQQQTDKLRSWIDKLGRDEAGKYDH